MAFPVVESGHWIGNSASSASTNHVITMPSGLASGDFLLVAVAGNTNTTAFSVASSGLTEITDSDTGFIGLFVGWKVATGSEGASLTVTSTGSDTSTGLALRITSWHGSQAPSVGTAASGSTQFPDPPSLAAGWGANDNLWVVISGLANPRTQTIPTNYTGNSHAGVSGGTGIAYGWRQRNIDTEDPGTFDQGATGGWITQTVVIRPAAGGGGGSAKGAMLRGMI